MNKDSILDPGIITQVLLKDLRVFLEGRRLLVGKPVLDVTLAMVTIDSKLVKVVIPMAIAKGYMNNEISEESVREIIQKQVKKINADTVRRLNYRKRKYERATDTQ